MGMRDEEVQHDSPISGVVPFTKSEKRVKLVGQDRNQIWHIFELYKMFSFIKAIYMSFANKIKQNNNLPKKQQQQNPTC